MSIPRELINLRLLLDTIILTIVDRSNILVNFYISHSEKYHSRWLDDFLLLMISHADVKVGIRNWNTGIVAYQLYTTKFPKLRTLTGDEKSSEKSQNFVQLVSTQK